MTKSSFKILFFVLASLFSLTTPCHGEGNIQDQHIKVSMRMIGHQTLLNVGDSTSRVLPIEKVAGRYKIPFEAEFELTPDDLFVIIQPILEKHKIAGQYIVELEKCESKEVVYSYEYGIFPEQGLPCRGRRLPKDCYTLFITIIQPGLLANTLTLSNNNSVAIALEEQGSYITKYAPYLAFLLTLVLAFYLLKKRRNTIPNNNILTIGAYRFDKRNMILSYNKERIELSSKESELLLLLHDFTNETIKREVILNKVWGDEGDYIGRTLDVYISKLRKRLEGDANIKIINIRGVGYKLILND